jgi:hypothetical protein
MAKKTPYHFGQIDFNMFNVTWVVFFTSKTKTIWLVILISGPFDWSKYLNNFLSKLLSKIFL